MRGSSRLQRAWTRRGPLAATLLPLALLHGLVQSVRRRLYRAGILGTERLPVPVVVVGNLVAGGAGKTPTVRALVGLLRDAGYRPGIVSRGYRGSTAGVLEVTAATPAALSGDEPLLLHLRGGVPVVVGRARAAAARALLHAHPEVDVIVSDDGLQHLALARDLQIVVFDERGVGNGWLMPAGPLREALATEPPPKTLVLYNATSSTTSWHGALAERRLAGAVSLEGWWRGKAPTLSQLEGLRGRRLVAAAGLARPERFFAMLDAADLRFEPLALPDHYAFATLPWAKDTSDVIVTEKDAVKLDPARVGPTQVWVAALDFSLPPAFAAEVLRRLGPPITR